MPLPVALANALFTGLRAMAAEERLAFNALRQKAASQGFSAPADIKISLSKGKKFKTLERFFLSPQAVLNVVGPYLVNQTRRGFYKQKRGAMKWRARRVPNWAGILRDLTYGDKIKASRWESRPALIDTGRLRDSFKWRATGKDSLQVYSTAVYSGLMQDGGPVKLPVSPIVKGKIFRKQNPETRKKLGLLLKVKEIHVQVPPREILTVTDEDIAHIQKIIIMMANGRQRQSIGAIGTADYEPEETSEDSEGSEEGESERPAGAWGS